MGAVRRNGGRDGSGGTTNSGGNPAVEGGLDSGGSSGISTGVLVLETASEGSSAGDGVAGGGPEEVIVVLEAGEGAALGGSGDTGGGIDGVTLEERIVLGGETKDGGVVGELGGDGREVSGSGGGGGTVSEPLDVTVGSGGDTADLGSSALELRGAELVADHSGVDLEVGKGNRGDHADVDVDHDGGGAGPAGDLESGGGGEASGSGGSAAGDGAGGDLGDGITESRLSEGSVDTLVGSAGGATRGGLGHAEEDLPRAGEEATGASSPGSGSVGDAGSNVLDMRGAHHDLGGVSVGGGRGGSNTPVTVGAARLGVGGDSRGSTISDAGEGDGGNSLAIVSASTELGSGIKSGGVPSGIPVIDAEADSVVRGSGSAEGARGSGDLAGGVGEGETDIVRDGAGARGGVASDGEGGAEVDGDVLPAEGKSTSGGGVCNELLGRGDGRGSDSRGVESAGTSSEEGKGEGFHSKVRVVVYLFLFD